MMRKQKQAKAEHQTERSLCRFNDGDQPQTEGGFVGFDDHDDMVLIMCAKSQAPREFILAKFAQLRSKRSFRAWPVCCQESSEFRLQAVSDRVNAELRTEP